MRIFDEDNKRTTSNVLIMLTPSESKELIDKLQSMNPEIGDHFHLNDLEYKREMTFLVYTPENLKFFNEQVRNIINE